MQNKTLGSYAALKRRYLQSEQIEQLGEVDEKWIAKIKSFKACYYPKEMSSSAQFPIHFQDLASNC